MREDPYVKLAEFVRQLMEHSSDSLDQNAAFQKITRFAQRHDALRLSGRPCVWDGVRIRCVDRARRFLGPKEMIDFEIITAPDGEIVAMDRLDLPLRLPGGPAETNTGERQTANLYPGDITQVDVEYDEHLIQAEGYCDLTVSSARAQNLSLSSAADKRAWSPVALRDFTQKYVVDEKGAGRQPTMAGLERATRDADKRFPRRALREAFKAAGCVGRRGAPNIRRN